MHTSNKHFSKKRCEYLDCVKGLSILCISFLHFEDGVIPHWINTWIGMFMITTFYFTSGWIFGIKDKIDKPRAIFKKRLRQLGIPYLWFTIIIILFDLIWCGLGFMAPQNITKEIYKTITLRGIGTLWFLPVLLFGEYLFCFVKTSSRPWLIGSILFVITLSSSYFYYNYWMVLYRNLNVTFQIIDSPIRPIIMALCSWPIIVFGYLMCRNIHLNRYPKSFLALFGCLLIIISILFIIYPPFNIFYVNSFISNTLPTIGFIGIFFLIADTHLGKFFSYWGRNSLVLMCTHFSITMEVLMKFDQLFMQHKNFEGPRTIIYFVVAILLTYPLVWVFNGPLRFVLGKNYK